MGKDQDIRLNIEAQGADQTAAQVGKVDAAQKGLTDKTKDAKKPTEELDAATKKLTATEETYTSLLSRIHPSLGALADVMIKGSRVVGDFATQQINLRKVLQTSTAAIRANWNALKLFLAGGAVIAGISAITASLARMREEAKRVATAIQGIRDALNKLKEARAERQAAIEQIADMGRGAPMTASESRRAAQMAETIQRQFPQIGNAALNQIAALMPQLSQREMTSAAILLQQGRLALDPRMSVDTMRRRFDSAMRQHADRVTAFVDRETSQTRASAVAGRAEAGVMGGSTFDIQQFIRSLPGQLVTEADISKVSEIVAGRLAIGEDLEVRDPIGLAKLIGLALADIVSGDRNLQLSNLEGIAERLKAEGIKDAAPYLIRQAELVLQQLEKAARAMERAADQPRTMQIMPRNTFPDSHSQRRAIVNGQTYRARIGDG